MTAGFSIFRAAACALAAALPAFASAQTLPAFPGADGAAANVTGGRGGIVYHVTKLNSAIDDPQRDELGTIRYGLNNANFPAGVPRTIVFDVGGVFHLGRLPQATWDPNGNGWDAQSRLTVGGTNVTLAGQTAPGAGVIFMGGGLKPQGNNNIIRNITVASGYGTKNFYEPGDGAPIAGTVPDSVSYDGMDVSGTNIMIDHVSTVYASDETISMNENANNITVQYSNISQGLNYPQFDAEGDEYEGHALGSLLQAGSNAKISVHHNLYAHLKGRLPRVGSEVGTGAFNDFRNNVFYNWLGTAGQGAGSSQPSFNNFVNNFYLAGDGGDDAVGGLTTAITTRSGGTGVFSGGGSATRVYQSGNFRDQNKDADANDGVLLTNSNFGSSSLQATPYSQTPYVGVTDPATVAFDRVLNYVGANWWTRDDAIDTIDERIIHETRTGTGQIVAWADDPFNANPNEGMEWRTLKNTPAVSRALDWDVEPSDGYGVGDGMPTWWELLHGLDPNARDNNGDFDADGYMNVEEYLNEIAAWPAPAAIVFSGATNARYAQATNWDANADPLQVHPWQPSRYDDVEIPTGTVAVDAVGQHAGRLRIAPTAGDAAVLNVTGGWLSVANELVIGTSLSQGALALSGGELSTAVLSKGTGGEFDFTGGVLHADLVNFDLEVDGGTLAPGLGVGVTEVQGGLALNAGVLEIDIGGTSAGEYDRVEVHGVTTLGGTLRVKLVDLGGGTYAPQLGDAFAFLAGFGGTGGMFAEFDLPTLEPGFAWAIGPGDVATFLSVVPDAGSPADFNGDGAVDGEDLAVWQAGFGLGGQTSNEHGDADGDGVVDGGDFLAWQRELAANAAAKSGVPEPTGWALGLIALGVGSRRFGRLIPRDRTRQA